MKRLISGFLAMTLAIGLSGCAYSGIPVPTAGTEHPGVLPSLQSMEQNPDPASQDRDSEVEWTEDTVPLVPSTVSEEGCPGTGGDFADPTPEQEAGTENPMPERLSELEAEWTAQLASLQGTWSLYFMDGVSHAAISVQPQPMVAASLIKLFIAGAYFDAVDAGRISDNARTQVRVMLDRSDNQAANTLIDRIGMEEINAFIVREGFVDTKLNRHMLEAVNTENYTSPHDCVVLLDRVLSGAFVSAEASEEILSALKAQQRTGKIPAGLPQGVRSANKTGELFDTENDAAIVWTENGVYLLCIMATDLSNPAAARAAIIDLSKTVYSQYLTMEKENGGTQ